MKTPDTKLEWHDAETAAKWPEGSVVMHCPFKNGFPVWDELRFSSHHRPDWCNVQASNVVRFMLECRWVLIERKKK